MLTQFSVSNYRSIKEEITFSMQATSILEHKEHLIKAEDGCNYLPISAIYGPNGSGKSNICKAISELSFFVRTPFKNENKKFVDVKITPFLFDESTLNKPSTFNIYYLTKESEYQYEIHIKENTIIYESLSQKRNKTKRTSRLFKRTKENIELFNSLKGLKVTKDLSDSISLLSYLYFMYENNETVSDAYYGFIESTFSLDSTLYPFYSEFDSYNKNSGLKKLALQMIKEMDIDIVDVRIEDANDINKIYTKHIINKNEFELPIVEESNGTKKLFSLMILIAANLKSGSTLIIDELDANIHPKLIKHIVGWYTDPKSNINHSQLIFTSHDLANMNKETYRRDEIWFVAKGNNQESILYSLAEFKDENGMSIRNDAKYDKQYLEGKYGADPFLRKMIDWEKING